MANRMHSFSDSPRKLFLESSCWLGTLLIAMILSLFTVGCANTAIEPDVESSSGELNQQIIDSSQAAFTNTPMSSMTTTDIPILTPTSSSIASASITSTPNRTLTVSPSIIPTSIPSPGLLIASTEIQLKGGADEIHEIWLIDTKTEERRLVFTTTPGTRLTQMMWGDEKSDILYVTEVKGIGEGQVTWQLYKVNYETGNSQSIFAEPMEGMPALLDLSTQGKWLRIWVDYFEPSSFEWWFINTKNGTVIKNSPADRYLSGFVWSPNDPDIFAYFQEATTDEDSITPQSVIISKVTKNFETLDQYQYTSLTSGPLLMWDSSAPEQIIFFALGEMYFIDLTTGRWILIAEDLDIIPEDRWTEFLKSPSGQWAVTTTFIRAIQMDGVPQVVERFEDNVGQGHRFLSWYNETDWIVISTRDGQIQIYEPGNNFNLLHEINLNDYGLNSPESAIILAKPLN